MALKSQFLPQNCKNRQGVKGSAPSVTRLSSNGLFSTGPKLDNFSAKNIPFGSRSLYLSKILVDFLVVFTPANKFFKRLYSRMRNELINAAGLICLFFQRWIQNCSFKISVFMCKNSVFYSVPHFRLGPSRFVWSGDGTAGSMRLSRSKNIFWD